MLGWERCEPITIPHPLQILAADMVYARADAIVDAVIGRILAHGSG